MVALGGRRPRTRDVKHSISPSPPAAEAREPDLGMQQVLQFLQQQQQLQEKREQALHLRLQQHEQQQQQRFQAMLDAVQQQMIQALQAFRPPAPAPVQLSIQKPQQAPAAAPSAQQAPAHQGWVPMAAKFLSGDLHEVLSEYEACATASGWTEQEQIQRLGLYLDGLAFI